MIAFVSSSKNCILDSKLVHNLVMGEEDCTLREKVDVKFPLLLYF